MVTECGPNVFCCGVLCDCDNVDKWFVDPVTGQVQKVMNISEAPSTESPIYWSLNIPATDTSSTAPFSSFPTAPSDVSSTTTQAIESGNAPFESLGTQLVIVPQTTIIPNPTNDLASNTSPPSTGNGLSAGVGAGIAVGSIATLAALVALAWLLLRLRRSNQALRLEIQRQKDMAPVCYELDPHSSDGLDRVKGCEGALRHAPFRQELNGVKKVHELHAGENAHEVG